MTTPEPDDLSPSLGALADDLTAAWVRVEATLRGYRVEAMVPLPGIEDEPRVYLHWHRFGGEWKLTIGDDEGSGIEVERASLDLRLAAVAVAKALVEKVKNAEAGKKRSIETAIAVLDAVANGRA